MTETSATGAGRKGHGRHGQGHSTGPIGGFVLFVRQVLDELRKVVRPTWPELVRYTVVVLSFVILIMLLVGGLDFGFHKLVGFTLDSGQ